MEYQLSSSSINSGVPLLPPLVTNDIATEIQYYKTLAVAVEERLKALEIIREATLNKSKNESDKENFKVPTKNYNIPEDLANKSDNSDVTKDTSFNETLVDIPIKDDTACLIDFSSDPPEKDDENSNGQDKNINQVCELNDKDSTSNLKQIQTEGINKATSDEDKSCLNDSQTIIEDSTYSDTITASTDLNQYLNTSASTKTDTTETTPENWKPQVPKTLNIVPITLDKSKPPDKSSSVDEETPKLVRRGSYILDRPSPVLLAHIQSELPSADYKPTTSAQAVKHKEWTISQIKADLKGPTNLKESKSRLNSVYKSKRNNHSNVPSQRVCKSVSSSKTGSPMDIYQTKSVDCIQTIFAKECNTPKTPTSSRTSHYKYSPGYSAKSIRNNGLKKPNKNTPILNLADKLSESLGSLNSNSPKPVKRPEKKIDKDSNLNKSIDQDSVNSVDQNIITKKQKPVITSEKIVTVFKEIQDTHKKQMIELMSRQQKEQMQMQENFKKQQILLLAQIRKAFPEISISALTEAISGKNAEHTMPLSSKTGSTKSESSEKDKGIAKPQMNGINYHKEDRDSMTKSSVDYYYSPRDLSSTSCHLDIQPTTLTTSFYQNNCQATQTFDETPMFTSRSQLSNVKSIDDIPVGVSNRRRSSVSRQLFPLESKSIPILDNSLYTDKHIKAATIINAYAKGFLVRRLMKSEKVIALKNTYREALHCMLRLHVDAPLNLPELNFHQRLQLQCDAASMNIVDLFSQSPTKRMEIIAHDREIKKARSDRPSSARSYSFATQRTLARKKMKEMGLLYPNMQNSVMSKSCPARTRCQTWTSNSREKKITTSLIGQGIKRSTSAVAVRKPWR